MKKRLLTLALALALCLSLAVPALAAETPAEKEVPDGAYTLVREGSGEYVAQQFRDGAGGGFFGGSAEGYEKNATTYPGYYQLSSDAGWQVTNNAKDQNIQIGISMDFSVPIGNNDYAAGAGFGTLIDRNGEPYGNTASGEDWDNLDRLRPGDTAIFTLDEILADEGMASTIEFLNSAVGRGAKDTKGILMILSVYQSQVQVDEDGYRSIGDTKTDRYCYMLGENRPTGTPGEGDVARGFTDVKHGDWFYDPVQWAVDQGITTGTTPTTFSPTQDCTVAQILTFLWRAEGSPEAAPMEGVDPSAYYAKATGWAAEKGILGPDEFGINVLGEPCERGMAVWIMWMAAGQPKAAASSFSDVTNDLYYWNAVDWAVAQGITTGTSATTFDPETVCNRGHIVTFLYRAFAK